MGPGGSESPSAFSGMPGTSAVTPAQCCKLNGVMFSAQTRGARRNPARTRNGSWGEQPEALLCHRGPWNQKPKNPVLKSC